MTRPGDLDLAGQASLDSILASSPELAALTEHVRAFARLMTGAPGPRPRAVDDYGRRQRRARTDILRYRPAR
jgi:hypothetical protein